MPYGYYWHGARHGKEARIEEYFARMPYFRRVLHKLKPKLIRGKFMSERKFSKKRLTRLSCREGLMRSGDILPEQDSRRDRLVQFILAVLMIAAISALAVPNLEVSAKLGLTTEDRPVVVLDAGHGGMDPGKIGANDVLEKDVNLCIVQKLKVYLEANDVIVYLTRETDDGLYKEEDSNKKVADLSRRCALIEEIKPEIVVSIHQNSYSNSTVCGPQIFYYKTSQKGQELAQILQERLNAMPECLNQRNIKANGDYYLLLHVSSPIVIAETGFLSNWEEAEMLVTEEYQDRLAWELCMGILEYLR